MTQITDDDMREMLTQTKAYTVVLLKATPARQSPKADAVIWEHGRRNFSLRADGLLPIVCPIVDDRRVERHRHLRRYPRRREPDHGR